MNFQQTQFFTSAATLAQCPLDSLSEVAFAGRSNAGKSSAINTVTVHGGLARTSKTPGRTQLINFFRVEDGRYIVDLPGYGFAQVPLEIKEQWQYELEQYLRNRTSLAGLVVLSDIRHPLRDFDRMMIRWAAGGNLPLHLLLTKADKLKRGAAQNTLLAVKKELSGYPLVSVQLFSSVTRSGVEELLACLSRWLAAPAGMRVSEPDPS